ncbi:MAG: alcohol dehydrogenase catalytic domain-containing protein [Robiginitomaculum sp.]|nr:alcohol dehydrogenase catalytic domain-containing protein [Robiginitomaculum sp.]
MQQLQFIAPRKFEWQEVKSPQISNDKEALVKPLAVSRCDLDLYIANGAYPLKGSFAFGHEIAGEVIAIGDGVKNVIPGTRVIVPFQINCGECGMCRNGLTNACENVPKFSAYGLAPSSGKDWGGGFSDLISVPFADAMLVPIPSGVSLTAAAALSDNVVDGYRTVADTLHLKPDGNILVVGGLGQSVALFAVAFAKALGNANVDYHDNHQARLKTATSLGAKVRHTDYASSATDKQYEIVIDASATTAGLLYALKSTKACGVCVSISHPVDTKPELPLQDMYMKGVNWTLSRVHARGSLDKALGCVTCGKVDPDAIISTVASFQQAPDLLPENSIKTVFVRD